MRPSEYRIVSAEVEFYSLDEEEGAAADLSQQVSKALAEGWELVGGVAVCPGPKGDAYLLQALVKR